MNRTLITEELINTQALLMLVDRLLRATDLNQDEWLRVYDYLDRTRTSINKIMGGIPLTHIDVTDLS